MWENSFSPFISGASRLPNGNTLINEGDDGIFREVTYDKEIVWRYVNPMTDAETAVIQGTSPLPGGRSVHRCHRYAPDYPGLAGKDLTPGYPIEQYPNVYFADVKPGSCKNPVNRKSKGVLPVAIEGEATLDVRTIDPSSIFLEGFPADRWSTKDVSAPDECDGADGEPDLVLKWDSELIKVAMGNVSKGDEPMMLLTGYSDDGWFLGTDYCRILK